MSSSSSSKKNYTTTSTTTVSKPMTLQDVEGLTIADVGGAVTLEEGFHVEGSGTINVTDGDAVKQALQFAQNASEQAFNFAYDAGRPETEITKQQIWAMVAIVAAVFLGPRIMKG